MGVYSIAEAEDRLSELIDCATAGEKVVIARDDGSMVELTAPKPRPGPIADAELDRLAERRKGRGRLSSTDVAALASRSRDRKAQR